MFGAMFAPKPFDVAKEMVRVTRSGGRIVMGNWIPGDPTLVAQILKISAAYSPPPPEGFISPMTWGIENDVIVRFAGAGMPKEKISFVRDTYVFNYPGPPSELVDAFRKYYGPTMNAFEAADKNGRAGDLQKELDVLFNSQNKSPSKDATSIPATFLRVTPTPDSADTRPSVRSSVCGHPDTKGIIMKCFSTLTSKAKAVSRNRRSPRNSSLSNLRRSRRALPSFKPTCAKCPKTQNSSAASQGRCGDQFALRLHHGDEIDGMSARSNVTHLDARGLPVSIALPAREPHTIISFSSFPECSGTISVTPIAIAIIKTGMQRNDSVKDPVCC